MGRFEKRPENPRAKGDAYGAAETALRAVTEELQIIQRNLLKSLQEDVKRLQTEKNRLADDIQRLQAEKEQLQQGQIINEQQALVRQLAQVLADHISTQLQSSLDTLATQAVERSQANVSFKLDTSKTNAAAEINENAEKLLGSLDDTLTITFNSLQQELKNYQSSLSQQLSRMTVQQHQGEEILVELVNRLHQELEKTTADPPEEIKEAPSPEFELIKHEAPTKLQLDSTIETQAPPLSSLLEETATVSYLSPSNGSAVETTISPPPAPVVLPSKAMPSEQEVTPREPLLKQMGTSLPPIGLFLIVVSTVVSSLYNVAVKVFFNPDSLIFGMFEVERLISPTLGNSLLILMLRMLVVVPLMLVLAPILHPQVWQDLQNLVNPTPTNATTKRVLVLSIVSGCFLFLSQVLIYLALGQVPTGIAIALFFVYPIISGLLSWLLFRDRPNLFSSSAIAFIGLGELLVLFSSTSTGIDNISMGNITAIGSGMAFALYVILTRICAAKLHPVTFTLINFVTMLLLSFLGFLLPLPTNWNIQINPNNFLELVLSAFVLGVMTLCSYLLNNFGIRKIGATRSAMISATVPALTVIFAGLIIQETLPLVQVLGVLLITLGAGTFSFEKMRNRIKPFKHTN